MPIISDDVKLDYKDVLIRPRRSMLNSRAEVDLTKEITFRNSRRTYKGIPVIASNMDSTGTFEMAKALSKHGLFTSVKKYYTLEEWKDFAAANPECLDYVAPNAEPEDADFELISSIVDAIPQLSFISTYAHSGYMQSFIDFVKRLRSVYPTHTIIAGDVVTGDIVEQLILAGADIVNVGIGAGSVCTTRLKTGVGYPQLSAVIECANAAHGLNAHIVADGGCTCTGDFAKAFGAGADFVMAGGIFAGHDQGGGEIIEKDGKRHMSFYGMCSTKAIEIHDADSEEHILTEGKIVEISYKGDVETTVLDILGDLRSTCTYVGATSLQELPQRTTFVRVTQQFNPVFGSPAQN